MWSLQEHVNTILPLKEDKACKIAPKLASPEVPIIRGLTVAWSLSVLKTVAIAIANSYKLAMLASIILLL